MAAILVLKDGNYGFFRVVKYWKRREGREKKKEIKGRKKREIGRPTALDALLIWVGQVVDFGWDRHIDYDD